MTDIIAVLEDDPLRTAAMQEEIQRLFPSTRMVFFDNAPDMLSWLESSLSSVRLLCLDHDLGPNRQRHGQIFDPGIGRDVSEYLATQKASCPVLIHSSNMEGAYSMQFMLKDAGWFVERVSPYDDLKWITEQWSERVSALGQMANNQSPGE